MINELAFLTDERHLTSGVIKSPCQNIQHIYADIEGIICVWDHLHIMNDREFSLLVENNNFINHFLNNV